MTDTFVQGSTLPVLLPQPFPDPAVLSDAEVVTRVCAGETALFELLMRRHNQRIFRALRSVLRDDAEAEDAMQECYVRAWRQLSTFEHRSSVATWLTRIGVNLALDRLRRAGRVVSLEPAALERQLDSSAPLAPGAPATPEDIHAGVELRAFVMAAIDELPAGYRSVFVLREIEGLDTRETAESLGIREATVKTRLHRARAQLRSTLLDRIDVAPLELLEFGGERCNRVVARVMARLATERS